MKLTHQTFCAIFIFALSAFDHVQSVSWDFLDFFRFRVNSIVVAENEDV